MSTFRQIYEGIEKTFWNSLTKKLFSFLLLFALNLGYLVIWLDRREAVEVALAKATVAPELLASVAEAFDVGLYAMLALSALALVMLLGQILYLRHLVVRPIRVITAIFDEIARVAHLGFRTARERRKKLTSVDKANVLASSRLWREVVVEVSKEYPDVALEHVLVDAMTMHLIRRPRDFDVVIADNMFGDIITDEASMLTGSMGMLASASLGEIGEDGLGLGMYEPIHGSAPDIAGQGIANPLAMVLTTAMLLRHSCGLEEEAQAVERAVMDVIESGLRTADLAAPGEATKGTREMADEVLKRLGA